MPKKLLPAGSEKGRSVPKNSVPKNSAPKNTAPKNTASKNTGLKNTASKKSAPRKSAQPTGKGAGSRQNGAEIERLSKRDSLITRYQPYVHGLVGKMIQAMSLPPECQGEFVSAGYMGLVEAAERFDPTSNADFKTYAYLRIRGAVIDYIRENSELSGKAYRCAKALAAVQHLRESESREAPKGGEPPKLAEVLDFAARGALMYRLSFGDSDSDLVDVQSNDASVEQALEQRQEREKIRTLVATLPEKERSIVEDYYLKEKSFVEIAHESEGMSKSWISRLHSRALQLLKERILESNAAPS